MGTWGVGPFDNDSAANMVIKMMKPIKIILGGPDIDTVLRALLRMSLDDEWLDDWRNPRKIVAQIEAEIRIVRGIIEKSNAGARSSRIASYSRKKRGKP